MHMIDLRLDPERLVRHAEAEGHNRPDDEDLGYATHGWLQAALGALAPWNFRLLSKRTGELRLLGYGPASADDLREHAASFAPPLAAQVTDWRHAASKPMNDVPLKPSQRLGFEVRICPVVRGRAGEQDAFLAEAADLPDEELSRTTVYGDWLEKRLKGIAELDRERFALQGFRLASMWRRNHHPSGQATTGRRIVRPDALVAGTFTVRDNEGLRQVLARGIGRHRAFGFGMVLLKPA